MSKYDGLERYFSEMCQFKLLSPEEEVSLFKKLKSEKFSDAEKKKIRQTIINANLRLVVTIANNYTGISGCDIADLIAVGNRGLTKAVDRFELKYKAKISTYASFWIKQEIRREIQNHGGPGHTIRIPVYVQDLLYARHRATKLLINKGVFAPTDEQLGSEVGRDAAKMRKAALYADRRVFSLEASLDPTKSDGGGLEAMLADTSVKSPSDSAASKDDFELLHRCMRELPPRSVEIINYRYGFDGGKEKTLEEVGQKFGITRERVRQIQVKAVKILRQYYLRNGKEDTEYLKQSAYLQRDHNFRNGSVPGNPA